jgi:hypothetical protein
LDDRSTWTYLLQEQLAAKTGRLVEVINTGLSGTRAINHLATLRRILAYAPDCALFLVGVNDWNKQIREHFGSDFYGSEQAKFKWTLLGRGLQAAHDTLMGWSEPEPTGGVQLEDGSRYTKQNDSLARPDQRTLAFDHVAPDYSAEIEEIGAEITRLDGHV